MRVLLVPLNRGTTIEFTLPVVLLGCADECDVQLDNASVSDLHCVIVQSDELLLLHDPGSTNGTRVNGQRVRRSVLLRDDELHLGRLRYRVHITDSRESPNTGQ